jgi:hypothetical protein
VIVYRQATRDGVVGWEIIYAAMVKFTVNKWQADIYYHQALLYYERKNLQAKEECDESTCPEVDN